MLDEYEQNSLLKSFPNAELSYEIVVHNKVQNADYVLAIPEGKKFFAWFTVFKKQNVCVLMEIGFNKQICGLQIVHCCFHDKLSFGTIFYGVVFTYNGHRFFAVENLLHYKGKDCSTFSYDFKLKTLCEIFKKMISQRAHTKDSIVFGLPLLNSSFTDLMKKIPFLPYKIKSIQFREKSRDEGNVCYNMAYGSSANTSTNTENRFNRNLNQKIGGSRERVFQVKPDLQNDIYHLFASNKNNVLEYYNIAYIPDYKTSVMMNNLFRNIKENANLDALEESDDEEEFENDREDKFVYLERVYNIVCEFNFKFKKWTPLRLAQRNDRIVTRDELTRLEKNNY